MIVRELKDCHIVAMQPEHARQSAVITSALRPEFFDSEEERQDIITATEHHDDGWYAWEEDPKFDHEGLPLNFPDISEGCHQKNWFRTIELARNNLAPMAAAVIARHAGKFLTAYGGDTAKRFHDLLPSLKEAAWPGKLEEFKADKLERCFAPLLVGDTLSLIAAAGWTETRRFTLYRKDNQPFVFHAWREGDFKVRVDPWPFVESQLCNVYIDAYRIPRGKESETWQLLRQPDEFMTRLNVDFLPTG